MSVAAIQPWEMAPSRVSLALLLWLMRFLSLRLNPKAEAAPKTGNGPGTLAVIDKLSIPQPSSQTSGGTGMGGRLGPLGQVTLGV